MQSGRGTFWTLALLTLLAASPTAATGLYVGGSLGQTSVELDLEDLDGSNLRIDDEDLAYKLFVGFRLGPFGIEGSYRDLGEVDARSGPLTARSETEGLDAFLVGGLPLGPVFLFAKAGLFAWETEVRTQAAPGTAVPELRVSEDGTDLAWGVGLSLQLGKLGVRGEFEQFEIDVPNDLTMVTVGVSYRF